MIREQTIELLKLYYAEHQYLHENLWKRMIQFFVVIFFTSTLPVTIKLFKGAVIPPVPLVLFPVTGILLTLFYLWYSLSEAVRLNAVSAAIQAVMRDLFPQKYRKGELFSPFDATRKAHPVFRLRIAVWVPVFFSLIELIIAVFMLILIFTNSLAS